LLTEFYQFISQILFILIFDGLDQQIIEILRTLKKRKIYVHSTNKNQDKENLADKLIKLSQQDFEYKDTLSFKILETGGFLSVILNGKMILKNILDSYLVKNMNGLTKMNFSLNLKKNWSNIRSAA
jgi:hypothetical protein